MEIPYYTHMGGLKFLEYYKCLLLLQKEQKAKKDRFFFEDFITFHWQNFLLTMNETHQKNLFQLQHLP